MSTDDTSNVALELHDITKRFGSVVALENVSLQIKRGRIKALLGENGAGKTTLMRVAFGMIQPDAGWISVNGARTKLPSPSRAIAAGIGMVHQQFSLIPAMTVVENVALGGTGRFSREEIASTLSDISSRTGLVLDPFAKVAHLSNADRQKLEIIRALAHKASVLILDEPTAVLTPGDVTELFKQLKSFAHHGGAVVLITHKLSDAREHADDVTVLRRGRLVLNEEMSATTDESLAAAMLGSSRDFSTPQRKSIPSVSTTVVSVRSVVLADNPRRSPVSLEIGRGEIVGIAALDGAATSLLRAIANRVKPLSGTIELPERIGFVPENRKDEALIADFSLAENLALADASSRSGVMDWNAIADETTEVIRAFDVRTPGNEVSPAKLSGGNQQRFVLGRELRGRPALLVLENPTQGLDLNAAHFVHEQLGEARDNGAAVVFYSSDLDELADLSDRVLVVSRAGVISVPPDRDNIGRALLGTDGS